MSHAEAGMPDPVRRLTSSYTFVVADIGITIRDTGLQRAENPRRRVFESEVETCDIELWVDSGRLRSASTGTLLFDSGSVWRLYDESGDRVFKFWLPRNGADPYKELRVDRDYRRGVVVLADPWPGSEPVDPLEYPLDELLMVHRLGRGLGCELHACGIVDGQGMGWLFVGHSGAGKSTLARLWSKRNVTVLSDDRIILREGDTVRMFGTPWHGEAGFAVATSAPLAGICIIEHGSENRIESLDPASAVSELMARAFLPFHEAGALETALDVLETAVRSAGCARFRFKPDVSAVEDMADWMREVRDV